jgi:hypothetical protein
VRSLFNAHINNSGCTATNDLVSNKLEDYGRKLS